MKRRLLWRVRRKLILSYIFIGVVPALLIIGFFLLGADVVSMNVSAYLFKDGYDAIVDDIALADRRRPRPRSASEPAAPQHVARVAPAGRQPRIEVWRSPSSRRRADLAGRSTPGLGTCAGARQGSGMAAGDGGLRGTDCRAGRWRRRG